MANTATAIVLVAGGATFVNEWYQTKQVNWKIPVATLLIGAAIDGMSTINDRAAIGLSVIVLIGAVTTKFDGKSIIDTLSNVSGTVAAAPKQKVQVLSTSSQQTSQKVHAV
jgi:hypothetical protein